MSDYTPTTDEIRARWESGGHTAYPATEFDQWLAKRDSEVVRDRVRSVTELAADIAGDILDELHFEPSTRQAEMDVVMDVVMGHPSMAALRGGAAENRSTDR